MPTLAISAKANIKNAAVQLHSHLATLGLLPPLDRESVPVTCSISFILILLQYTL